MILVKNFLISYHKADRAWAEWMAWQLEETGYDTALRAWDSGPNPEAERTLALLSPDSLASGLTQQELVAVRVRECDVQGLPGEVDCIDLLGLGEETAREALMAGARRAGVKPNFEPRYPGLAVDPERLKSRAPVFPGTLPAIWNIPYLRNPCFTGRQNLLDDVRKAFTAEPGTVAQAIHGPGGVGKTQLAVEYAYRHAADYALVWWLRAEEPTTLAADYVDLAGPLKLNLPPDMAAPAVRNGVKFVLAQRPGWLLIFDNARGPEEVREYIPPGAGGHVFITSRNTNWDGIARQREVEMWKRPESIEFLLKRTPEMDEEAARRLGQALGDLPLALEQAGAYVEGHAISLHQYLDLFRKHEQEIRKRGGPSPDCPAAVRTTGGVAFEELEKTSPAGIELLIFCGFLAPEEISLDLLRQGAVHLRGTLGKIAVNDRALASAVAALASYALVSVNWGAAALSVHGLVQALARERLSEAARLDWAEMAVSLLSEAFPRASDDPRAWPACSRLLPHALVACRHAEALPVAPEATARLWNQAGAYLRARAELVEARAAYERALKVAETAYGADHPDVATRLNNLGNVLHDLDDLAGARDCFERALKIDEAAFGPDHPKVAVRANNLGSVLRALGDPARARDCLERALLIDETAFGSAHPNVAIDLNNLGGVLHDLGDPAGARECFEWALGILRDSLGEDHPHTVQVRKNLEAL